MGTTGLWIGFNVVVLLLLALDLGVFHRRAHAESLRASIGWSVFWVALSLGFNAWVYFTRGHEAGLQFFTGYLIEKSLSVDNIFLFVVLFKYFQIEPQYQHRVLFWGILGALVMRGIMIAVGVELIQRFEWILYVFGVFLILAGVRMFFHKEADAAPEKNPLVRAARKLIRVSDRCFGQRFFIREGAQWVATPLFLALLVIESTDIAFAIDSIPAVFSVTRDPFIVYTSNVCAILGLRAFYFLLAGVLPYFRHLGRGLAAVLVLVGGKMLAARWVEVPTGVTLGGVALILTVAVMASVFESGREGKKTARRKGGAMSALSEAELIATLASPDRGGDARYHAARRLYEMGRQRALPALDRWRSEPEFACLLSGGRKSFPVVQLELDDDPQPYPAVATVGIAVKPDTFERIRVAAGNKPLSDVPPDQDAMEFEFNFMARAKSGEPRAVTVQLDILTTKDGGGAIAKFLAKFGEGIQQVEFDVTDVDRATQVLAEKLGQEGIYPATRRGADGTRVNFFLAAGADNRKILIELVEHPQTAR
ncbi:MAG TPA: TerC/Alx family metal homeostasis membrane protein [Candidatus Acidoferrales bacterium]|nr:TerC/Alx family metal homeostasis membrane protein [Candidatus Acidoferrales bacterium]